MLLSAPSHCSSVSPCPAWSICISPTTSCAHYPETCWRTCLSWRTSSYVETRGAATAGWAGYRIGAHEIQVNHPFPNALNVHAVIKYIWISWRKSECLCSRRRIMLEFKVSSGCSLCLCVKKMLTITIQYDQNLSFFKIPTTSSLSVAFYMLNILWMQVSRT